MIGRFVRSNGGMVVTPVLVVVIGFALYRYYQGAEKNFQDERALRWDANLRPQLEQHVSLALWSTILVIVVAVPLGVLLTRRSMRWLSAPILAVATSGQAIPAFGLLVLAFALMGKGAWTTVYALTLFSLLPVLRNTMVGLVQVSPSVVEAARGMGMSRLQVLRRIELPLAVPVILAGVRTALVINVGMAALAYLIGGGGLGITINAGLGLKRNLVLITGAGLTALVALTIDWIAALIERALRPRGL